MEGMRKFYLAIAYAILYTSALIVLGVMSKNYDLTSDKIFAVGTGYTGLIMTIVYGYKQEYKEKKK